MEIALIRHGRSLLTDQEKMTLGDVRTWVEKYDNHGVFEEAAYPSETIEKATQANLIVTSDLKRSRQSAKLLNPTKEIRSDPLFREVELPHLSIKKFPMKVRPDTWAVILRVLWFCGYSHQCESLRHAKKRAEKASKHLIEYADQHHSVILIGHGFFNRFIAKELQKKGWKGKKNAAAKHWSCTVYSLSRGAAKDEIMH